MSPETQARIHRLRLPGVSVAPIWNLPTEGRALWEIAGSEPLAALREAGLPEEDTAALLVRALSGALEPLLEANQVDAIAFGGGLTGLRGFAEALAGGLHGRRAWVLEGGAFAGARGGAVLLRGLGAPRGVVLDLGQTALKAAAGDARKVWPRDLRQAPVRLIGSERPHGTERLALLEHLAQVLSRAALELLGADPALTPDLLVGLPGSATSPEELGPCTFGWEGPDLLLPRLLELVDGGRPKTFDFQPTRLWTLNDAELAAACAAVDAPKDIDTVLTVTLGFGPGGALCRRSPR